MVEHTPFVIDYHYNPNTGLFFNYVEGTHLIETVSSYLHVKQDNEIPVLAMELLHKISIVSGMDTLSNSSFLTTRFLKIHESP
jgi:hypothetical protein